MKLHPQREKLIVRPLKIEAKTKAGIVLSENASNKEWRVGKVVEVGPGRDREAGETPTRIGVKPGNLIVYSPMAARYSFKDSLLEQYGLVPEGTTVVEFSEVMFAIEPETAEEIQRVNAMFSGFDETTLDEDSAENLQLRTEIAAEDRLYAS